MSGSLTLARSLTVVRSYLSAVALVTTNVFTESALAGVRRVIPFWAASPFDSA